MMNAVLLACVPVLLLIAWLSVQRADRRAKCILAQSDEATKLMPRPGPTPPPPTTIEPDGSWESIGSMDRRMFECLWRSPVLTLTWEDGRTITFLRESRSTGETAKRLEFADGGVCLGCGIVSGRCDCRDGREEQDQTPANAWPLPRPPGSPFAK